MLINAAVEVVTVSFSNLCPDLLLTSNCKQLFSVKVDLTKKAFKLRLSAEIKNTSNQSFKV